MKRIATCCVLSSLFLCLWSPALASVQTTKDTTYAKEQNKICGQNSLVSILRYFGKDLQLNDLLNVSTVEHGSNLTQLRILAEAYGLKTLPVKVTDEFLFAMRRPAILHVNGDHFIALLPNKAGKGFKVVDAPQSLVITDAKDLNKRWKWEGICLFIDEYEMVLPDLDAKPGTAKIFVDKTVFDAGVVFENTNVISPTFNITNKGLGDLVIGEIKTDCSCTAAAIDKKIIRPGESIPLTIDFHMKGLFGKLAQRKTIVKSNDPKSPTTLLTIKAERKQEFALKPLRALLGIIPMGTEKILLMKITPGAEDRQLSIKEAKSSSPFLEIAQLENEKNTKHYLLKFRLLPTVPPGLFQAVVRIPCIGASRKVLKIPVQAEIVGPIKTSLTKVQFGLIRLGEDNKTKRIKLRSGNSFDVLQTNCSQPWIEVVTKRVADNEHMLIVTAIPANTAKGKLEGVVNIETNVPDMNKISIPVYAFRL